MDKIATPQELVAQIRQLLAYAQSERPSRQKLAGSLQELANRVATNPLRGPDPTPDQIQESRKIIEKLKTRGYAPRSYSGRGMYGANCVGVTVSQSDAKQVKRLFGGASTDSMGMDVIVYWRQFPWPPGLRDTKKFENPEAVSTYLVTVRRDSWGEHTFQVESDSIEGAKEEALDMAGDHVFSEYDADYAVARVVQE